ncbi:MAG: hypothetical protein L3J98_11195 [Gammaproteobacteria bacterium]|nr:hypothetical protein [Gammaproteobacteria bacterium]MCF6260704.1 hypothetical protein [Gammaproteobacteria bacterium]
MNLKTVLGGCIGIASIMLVGCSGEESDPSPSNPPPSSGVDNVTLDGTAAKGIINGGNVMAEELDASGTVIARIGSTTTAADGSYTLTIDNDYNGGPIKVTISADENTQMKCDVPSGCGMRTDDIADSDTVIDFSEWYKPVNLTMMALVAEAVANDTISVSITPYTHLAARRAMAAPSLTPAEVSDANSRVSNLLGGGGINILNTQPLDITDAMALDDADDKRIAYAALSAAIAVLADTSASGGSPDINAALETLWGSFTDGKLVADDSGMATDDSTISLQEIVDGATSVFAQMNIADTSNTLVSLQETIDATTGGGSVNPDPGPGTGDTALEKVKTFVGDVRTWGTVIEEETRVKGDAFATQVDLAATAADASVSAVAGPAIRNAIVAVFRRLTHTTATELNDDAYKTGEQGDPQFESGTIAHSGGVVTITDGVIDGVTINLSVQLPDNESTVSSSLTAIISSATLRSASTDITINSGAINATLVTPYFIDYVAVDTGTADQPDVSGGSINLNAELTQKQDDLGAELASPVTFAGTLSTTLVNAVKDETTGELSWLTPATLNMMGNISDTDGNSFDASLVANISNADSFTPVTGPGSDSDIVLEDADNWLVGTIGLSFELQLDGLPKASINISGDRTAFETGTATVTIVYGVREIVIAGAFTDEASTGSVTITNQDGVIMNIVNADFNALTGDLEYNGQTYGSIDTLENGLTKITYTDGSFETF